MIVVGDFHTREQGRWCDTVKLQATRTHQSGSASLHKLCQKSLLLFAGFSVGFRRRQDTAIVEKNAARPSLFQRCLCLADRSA
jgi:hypothetical protein